MLRTLGLAVTRGRRRALAIALATTMGLGAVGAMIVAVPVASARAHYESSYGYDRTWNAALRMVRVDMGFKVTEKDEQGGYLLFEYRSAEAGNRVSSGSIELVRGRDAESPVRVVVQLPQMPQYHEQALVDSLSSKMRQEYGDPPPRKRPTPPPAPVADAGADAASSAP